MGSKTVLSLAASLYLLVIIGWVFTTYPDRYFLGLRLLVTLHLLGGVAASGVTLTLNTLSTKVAPEGQSMRSTGVAGVITDLGAGIGPILGRCGRRLSVGALAGVQHRLVGARRYGGVAGGVVDRV